MLMCKSPLKVERNLAAQYNVQLAVLKISPHLGKHIFKENSFNTGLTECQVVKSCYLPFNTIPDQATTTPGQLVG